MTEEVVVRCDVLVVGAGAAGTLAAVAASRMGAVTALLECADHPGGIATAAMHRTLGGLYAGAPNSPGAPLNGGLTTELLHHLDALNPNEKPQRRGRVWIHPLHPDHFRLALETLLSRETQLRTFWRTRAEHVRCDGGRILSVSGVSDMGPLRVQPLSLVDASCAGVILRACGAALPDPPVTDRPLAGYVVRLTGLQSVDSFTAVRVPYVLAHAVQEGRLPPSARFTTFFPGTDPGEGYCKLAVFPEQIDDPVRTRADAESVVAYLRGTLVEFRSASPAATSPAALPRDGMRLDGQYLLTAEDVLQGRKFPDAVARCAWPLEHWHRTAGPSYQYLRPGEWYEIPARALRARTIANLFAAGRCICATPEALSSARVLAACLATGEAAGRLAAQAARSLRPCDGYSR